jgi:hypothetical protein
MKHKLGDKIGKEVVVGLTGEKILLLDEETKKYRSVTENDLKPKAKVKTDPKPKKALVVEKPAAKKELAVKKNKVHPKTAKKIAAKKKK